MEYKIKIGFGDDDFIVIDETELAMAMRAQVTGKVGIFKEGSISGNNILEIRPYYNRLMGWNREYKLTDEDYLEVGTKRQKEHTLFLEDTKLALEGKKREEHPKEISDAVKQIARKANEPTWDR